MAPIVTDRAAAAAGVAARLARTTAIAARHIMTDPLMTYAYAGDASQYRLVPAIVVIVNSEAEVLAVIEAARAEHLPLTFRAAGTSLSGQSNSDGVLCVLGDGFKKIEVDEGGERITLGPAVIVAQANRVLKKFNRKLGPDPASQATCKIGGVVNNNSSGMCCGVAYNTYHTLRRLRVMLVDGTVLDSGDADSVAAFRRSKADLLEALQALHHEVAADPELVALIERKYRIKNTVGYSINALTDFHDPIDILVHLIVGSEGTLGFVSEVTYETIADHPHKVTGLIPFPDPHSCARAISKLANGGVQSTTGVTAAEYIERRALQTVEHLEVMQPYLTVLGAASPAVLIDISAPTAELLAVEIDKATMILVADGATHIDFGDGDGERAHALWDVRKGFFASAGAARRPGTSMLTEDVAAPIDRLADFVIDMRNLLDAHGYEDAVIFGHALAGNLHFQMGDDLAAPGAAEKFDRFSADLSELVSVRYGGSLKAEHGTGRAIAPFVEAEWGRAAYAIMRRIKPLFDPENLLNPGVLITDNKTVHLEHFKEMRLSDPIVDLCIECGFCEPACPSAQLTLSPRQRIVVTREMTRLRQTGEDATRLAAMDAGFAYAGLETCAAGNVCAGRCPVGIETGTMVLGERAKRRTPRQREAAHRVADHTLAAERSLKFGVGVQALSRTIIGNGATDALAGAARALVHTPRVSRTLRPGPGAPKAQGGVGRADPKTTGFPVPITAPTNRVVYFPACPTRMFGAGKTQYDLKPAPEAMLALLERAGFEVVIPEGLEGQCCGQPFLSKGFPEDSARVGVRLAEKLMPYGARVLTDASTCAKHLRDHHADEIVVADSAEFLVAEVLPKLTIRRRLPSVAVHQNCSAQRLKEQAAITAIATACGETIAPLETVSCCGFAGDKGLFTPELNEWATRFVKNDIPADCTLGVSTVSTCATGLSERAGIPFVSLASLLEYVSRPDAG
ncbi:MAG: FAD-binding and (Fe-S)-binding domain-containing protein [Devosia sp.]